MMMKNEITVLTTWKTPGGLCRFTKEEQAAIAWDSSEGGITIKPPGHARTCRRLNFNCQFIVIPRNHTSSHVRSIIGLSCIIHHIIACIWMFLEDLDLDSPYEQRPSKNTGFPSLQGCQPCLGPKLLPTSEPLGVTGKLGSCIKEDPSSRSDDSGTVPQGGKNDSGSFWKDWCT